MNGKTADAPPQSQVEEVPVPPKPEAKKPTVSTIIITYDHETKTLLTKVSAKDRLTVDGMLAGASRELAERELVAKMLSAVPAPEKKIVAPDSPEGLAAQHHARKGGPVG